MKTVDLAGIERKKMQLSRSSTEQALRRSVEPRVGIFDKSAQVIGTNSLVG